MLARSTLLGLLLPACAAPTPLLIDDPGLGDFLGIKRRNVPQWQGALHQPGRHAVAGSLVAAAALLQIDDLDRDWQQWHMDHHALPGSDENTISDVGNYALMGALLAPLLWQPHPERGTPREKYLYTNLYALTATVGLSHIAQQSFQRDRPDGSSAGFWSVHSSSSFVSATLLEREYGLAVGIPAYAVAAVSSLYRIEADRHWPSDVLVGAGFGIFVGNLLYEKNHGEAGLYRRYQVVPLVDKGRYGLLLAIGW